MELNLYGSKFKAYRGLAFALLLGALGVWFWKIDPTGDKREFSILMGRYVLPITTIFVLIAPVRILLGHPMLRVGTEGLRSYQLFKTRFTPWSEVRGLEIKPLPTGRGTVPALQIFTAGKPIVLTQALLGDSLDVALAKLVAVPEFATLLRPPPVDEQRLATASAAGGTFAELARRERGRTRKASWMAGKLPRFVVTALTILLVVGLRTCGGARSRATERYVRVLREEFPVKICAASEKALQRCYAATEAQCQRSFADAAENCYRNMIARNANVGGTPDFGPRFFDCAQRRYGIENQARLIQDDSCRAFHMMVMAKPH